MDAAANDRPKTFAARLAEHCIAEKGFTAGTLPAASALFDASDIVITFSGDTAFQIICMVDVEARPDRRFELSGEALRRIGEDCLAAPDAPAAPSIDIQVFEVGPGLDNQDSAARLAALAGASSSQVQLSGWIVDTAARSIWTSAPLRDGVAAEREDIERLLNRLRFDPSAPPAPAAAPPAGVPYLTYALLALLVAVFACELAFGIGNYTKFFEPSLATLTAMGGIYWPGIVENGEWYRLVSGTFLHADAMHLLLNGFVLLFAGRMLERAVGHAWFGAIYAAAGICGSLMSLMLNPTNVVGIGASGAIMGILSAAFVSSFRFAAPVRTRLQTISLQFLIPSLLPLAPAATGNQVDYGAHLGGAIGGAVVAAAMLANWPRTAVVPKFQSVAIAVAAAWALGALASAALLVPSYGKAQHEYALRELLIPDGELKRGHEALIGDAETLVARYPHDPRSHFYRATGFLKQGDLTQGERSLRAALDEQDILTSLLPPGFEDALRAMLALVQNEAGRTSEAKATAQPICPRLQTQPEAIRDGLKALCK